MTHWIRILGSVMIALGIATFVIAFVVGLGFYIMSLFQAQEYAGAIGLLGTTLISVGYSLRKFFNEPIKK